MENSFEAIKQPILVYNYALSHEYFVDVCVQLEWQPRTRRVRGCHSNCTQTSTKYEGDNDIVINTKIGFVRRLKNKEKK